MFWVHSNKGDGEKQSPAKEQQNQIIQKLPIFDFPSYSFSLEENSSLLYVYK